MFSFQWATLYFPRRLLGDYSTYKSSCEGCNAYDDGLQCRCMIFLDPLSVSLSVFINDPVALSPKHWVFWLTQVILLSRAILPLVSLGHSIQPHLYTCRVGLCPGSRGVGFPAPYGAPCYLQHSNLNIKDALV